MKKAKHKKDLLARIKEASAVPSLVLDDQANQACRDNNAELIARSEASPAQGGNIAQYEKLLVGQQTQGMSEYTYIKYEQGSPIKFVILVMTLMFESDPTSIPILAEKTTKMGISNKAHPCTVNTI